MTLSTLLPEVLPLGRKRLRLFVFAILALLSCPAPFRCAEAAETIRVAIYDNPPIIFMDPRGVPGGLFADVLAAVAKSEGWQVEAVPGTFSEGLERLEKAEVDLMAGVAFTPGRERKFSFSRETVLSNYGMFFQSSGEKLESLLDLNGRRVALAREDIYARGLSGLAAQFGLAFEAVEVDDYPDVFKALETGTADAGLVSRSYGQANQARFRVNRTPIVISPVELRFAAPLGRSAVLLQILDFHLGQMKTREDSAWAKSISRWIEGEESPGRLPSWVRPAAWVAVLLFLLALAAAVLFRKQAVLRTRQLLKSRQALHVHKDYLENLFQGSPEAIAFLDAEGLVVRVNQPFTELFGFSQEECQGRHLDDFLVPPERAEEARRATERARQGILNSFETVRVAKDGILIDVEAQGTPIYSEGGKVGEYFLYRDIRDRKATERALLANREDLRRSLERMDRAWRQTIEVLSSTAEARDPYTAGHQRNVALLAGAIAREMGRDERFVEGVVLASLVHDIGKIVVPAEILSKPGKLAPLEFDLIRVHPEAGASILRLIDLPWPLAEIVRQHHERLDGSGYPNGLAGGQLLGEARVIAVADVVEAMASHRPYRPALGIDRALEEILAGRGTRFDEQAVDACLVLFRERGFVFQDPQVPQNAWAITM
jgi:PAS domain S-box-containing protein/putative nucleotidyltransferase with HDIG domain